MDDLLDTQVVHRKDEEGTKEVCPRALGFARKPSEELTLRMLGQVLTIEGCHLDVVSGKVLTSELIARILEESPSFVVLASVPPGGLAQTSAVIKRLRAQFPALQIVVVRPTLEEDLDQVKARLKKAGATAVATTLLEAQDAIQPTRPTPLRTTQAAAAG
jgi:hypothetical protein